MNLTEQQKNDKIELTEKQLQAIHRILEKDNRVELIPTKYGVKIVKVKREAIK